MLRDDSVKFSTCDYIMRTFVRNVLGNSNFAMMLIVASLLVLCLPVRAEEQTVTQTYTFHLYFELRGTTVDADFMDNNEQLDALEAFFDEIAEDKENARVASVVFRGMASPEGSLAYSNRCARERLAALEKLVTRRVRIPANVIIKRESGIAWKEFADLVSQSNLPEKDTVLKIINSEGTPVNMNASYRVDSRVRDLMKLDNGRVWEELEANYFETLRGADVVVIVERTVEREIVQEVAAAEAVTVEDKAPKITIKHRAETRRWDERNLRRTAQMLTHPFSYQLDFKTNAAGWAVGLINGAVEIDICRYLAVHVPVYYSAYNYFVPTIKFRAFMVQPELRGYFRPNNEGWFVGAHFGLGYYNVAVNGDYRLQDHNGETPALGGGLAVGYRMPISNDGAWKMEFSLGAGAYKLKYDKFANEQDGLLLETKEKVYIGPDQFNISFIYSLDLQRGGVR